MGRNPPTSSEYAVIARKNENAQNVPRPFDKTSEKYLRTSDKISAQSPKTFEQALPVSEQALPPAAQSLSNSDNAPEQINYMSDALVLEKRVEKQVPGTMTEAVKQPTTESNLVDHYHDETMMTCWGTS